MNKLPQYTLVKIDMLDSWPLATVFDDEKYTILDAGDDLEKMLDTAIGGFFVENSKIKSYKQWLDTAEDGAYDFALLAGAKEIFRVSTMLLSQEVFNAVFLMKKYHGGQKRKGDDHPYIEHPLEVAHLLWMGKFDSDVVAAGYSHDLLEDTDCQEDEIEKACGLEVFRIVTAVSNDDDLSDKKDWEKKKEKYIETVRLGGEKAIAVSIADKIANLHSFFGQYEKEGPSIWKKFNRGKEKKLWFEKEVLKMAKKNWKHPLLLELERLVDHLEKTKE